MAAGGNYSRGLHLNRATVLGSDGPIEMSIPIVGGRNTRLPFAEVRIDEGSPWRRVHLHTLQTVYGNTPFYEYVAEDLARLYLASDGEVGILAKFLASSQRVVAIISRHTIAMDLGTELPWALPPGVHVEFPHTWPTQGVEMAKLCLLDAALHLGPNFASQLARQAT